MGKVIQNSVRAKGWRNKEKYSPTYNAGPTAYLPVVVCMDGEKYVVSMRFGFPRRFNSDIQINARGETLKEKGSYNKLIQKNRCVVVSEGLSLVPYFV